MQAITPRPLKGPLRSRIHTQAILFGVAQKALMLAKVHEARDAGASFAELEAMVCQMEARL